jgi:hypothetical protein
MTKDEALLIAKAISNVKATTTVVTIPYDVPSVLALVTLAIADTLEKVTPEFNYSQFLTDSE